MPQQKEVKVQTEIYEQPMGQSSQDHLITSKDANPSKGAKVFKSKSGGLDLSKFKGPVARGEPPTY